MMGEYIEKIWSSDVLSNIQVADSNKGHINDVRLYVFTLTAKTKPVT